ncbi:hypothetical protein [Brucella intermedia]|uniref:hypothetical protein n=1 Tax=Brucella intermedia TaxID=94625 RepID=UPI00224B1E94|nr:hypothetical protein [Brucella intermedia]
MKPNDLPLKPADMVAVIERTNLRPNPDNFLLPMFESISNSYHSISDKFGIENIESGTIVINIKKDPSYITVQDNGLGLNKECMESFRTPFTGQNLKKGAKVLGGLFHSRFLMKSNINLITLIIKKLKVLLLIST